MEYDDASSGDLTVDVPNSQRLALWLSSLVDILSYDCYIYIYILYIYMYYSYTICSNIINIFRYIYI